MELIDQVKACYEEIRAVRHQLHRCPELGHREVETTRRIRTFLEGCGGVEILDYGFSTGLAARIRGGRPGKLLALRDSLEKLTKQEGLLAEGPQQCRRCGTQLPPGGKTCPTCHYVNE